MKLPKKRKPSLRLRGPPNKYIFLRNINLLIIPMDSFDLKNLEIIIKLNQKGEMLAQVELRYGSLRIFGYRVMRSTFDDGLYINPPSVRAGSTWLWLVRVDNPEQWNTLQGMIKTAYLKEVKKFNENVTGDVENGITVENDEPFI